MKNLKNYISIIVILLTSIVFMTSCHKIPLSSPVKEMNGHNWIISDYETPNIYPYVDGEIIDYYSLDTKNDKLYHFKVYHLYDTIVPDFTTFVINNESYYVISRTHLLEVINNKQILIDGRITYYLEKTKNGIDLNNNTITLSHMLLEKNEELNEALNKLKE